MRQSGLLLFDTQSNSREMVERGTVAGKFTEDHLSLAIAIAHQSALAVEETRYHQALVHAERLAAVGQTIAAVSRISRTFSKVFAPAADLEDGNGGQR